ncbi:MAG: DUF1571 domain-containing protein [Phycisphaerae bacterium]|nr:DUF1571 domain-containing protein [Phycisphaerae bacterium]
MMNTMRIGLILLLAIFAAVGCNGTPVVPDHGHALKPKTINDDKSVPREILKLAGNNHVELLKESLKWYKKKPVKDYTCTLTKREVIRGSLRKEQVTKVKFRQKPFSVAISWVKNPSLGDRVLYVAGKNRDKQGRSQMVVRPTSWFLQGLTGGSVKRLPDSKDAMKETLRPVTMFGLENCAKSLLEVYDAAIKAGKCTQGYGGVTMVGGRKCVVLVRTLPYKKQYPAKTTYICLDVKTLQPLRVVGYGWKEEFLCNYEYHDIKINVGLTDKDFTPQANGIKLSK